MASKPPRPCKYPGCSELTREGWCPKHKPKHLRRSSAEYHDLYRLPAWREDLRPNQLLREPFCRECATRGNPRVRATEVDHIKPHRGDMRLFLDPGNLQSLCHRCHSRKTMAENPDIFRRKPGD